MNYTKLCFALLILVTFESKSQSLSDSAFEKKIAAEMCEEFDKKKATFTPENAEMQIGLMIMPVFAKYANEFKSRWNLDYQDEQEGDQLGERLGMLLALNCPVFTETVMRFELGKDDKNDTKTVSGVLVQIQQQQPLTFLVIKSSNGKQDKIWWLEYFEGSDKLQTGGSAYINKQVTISYKEVEWYDAANKEYKTYKVAVALK